MTRSIAVIAVTLWASAAFAEGDPDTVRVCSDVVDVHAKMLNVGVWSSTSCPAAAIAGLARLRDLEILSMHGEGVTDGVVALLREHPRLKQLMIANAAVSNASLVHVATMPQLVTLLMPEDAGLTGAGLAHLVKAPRLRRVLLSSGQLTDVGVAHLARIPTLEAVEADHPQHYHGYDNWSCDDVERCFDLASGTVTEAGLARLVDLPIEHLLLDPEVLTDRTLALLSRMKRLRGVNCGGVPGCFDLSKVHELTLAGLRHLAKLPVEHLVVDERALDRRSLDAITAMPGLSSLNCTAIETLGEPPDLYDVQTVEERCIDLSAAPASGVDLELLARLPETKRVVLPEGSKISRAEAATLGSLQKLRSIGRVEGDAFDLREHELERGALGEVARSRSLETLYLSKLPAEPDAVAQLRGAAALEHLVLEDAEPEQVEALLGLPGLAGLDAPPSVISKTAVALAVAHPKLRALGLVPSTCRTECLDRVRSCPYGEACMTEQDCSTTCMFPEGTLLLDLRGSILDRGDLSSLATSKTRIRLLPYGITDSTLAWASALPMLDSLGCLELHCVDLEGQQVTPAGLAHLGKIAGLERLRVPPELISNGTLALFSKLGSLTALNADVGAEGEISLADSTAVTPAGLRKLAALKAVKRVSLERSLVTDAAVAALTELPLLESLNCQYRTGTGERSEGCVDVEGTRVSARGAAMLAKLTAARRFVVPPPLVDDDLLRALAALLAFDSLNCASESCGCIEGPTPLEPSCVSLVGTKVTVPGPGIDAIKSAGIKRVRIEEDRAVQLQGLLPGVEVASESSETGEP